MTRRYKVVGAPNGVWLVVTDDPAERFVAWFSSRDEADAEASRLNHSSQGKTHEATFRVEMPGLAERRPGHEHLQPLAVRPDAVVDAGRRRGLARLVHDAGR